MSTKIYVVEDNQDISELVEFNLSTKGFEVEVISDGYIAYEKIMDFPPDLLILDLSLPGMSGIEICKYIRNSNQIKDLPIIMLTARSQETDKVIGLQAGADDYITKPFGVKELLARIEALLRRTKKSHNQIFKINDLEINFDSHSVVCHGEEIHISAKEMKFMKALVEANGRVLSRFDLIENIWDRDSVPDEHTVNVTVKRLRDKLGECKSIIKTVQGVGYRLNN